MRERYVWLTCAALLGAGAGFPGLGCTPKAEVEVKPIKVEPIHITLDINIRIEKKLDEFFAFQDGGAAGVEFEDDDTTGGKKK